VIVKVSPEAPGAGYLIAEAAERAQLPPGVVNILTADREVSELLVRDPRADKISFTGSTSAGRRIGSICGERIARCTLVVVPRGKHDEFAAALAAAFSSVRVGDPFDASTQMGPLAMERQRDRVEYYFAKGIEEGATLVTGGGRPKHLDRGYYIEATVFADVDNKPVIAQEEIFGPVLSVIPADTDEHAIDIANDSIYGLNASVFTPDVLPLSVRLKGPLHSLRNSEGRQL
jgi:acyl-CoA reductase-like NAD-dependent aldehyde dehydrogenase